MRFHKLSIEYGGMAYIHPRPYPSVHIPMLKAYYAL